MSHSQQGRPPAKPPATTASSSTQRWLAPLLLVGAGVALLVALAALLQGFQSANSPAANVTPQVTGGPSVSFERTFFEYGDVKFNTPIETIISLRNVGDQELVLAGEPRVEVVEGC